MNTQKERIAHNFSKAAARTYENVASVQKLSSSFLVNFFLQNTQNDTINHIIDIGTGTGFVVDSILPQFPLAHYTLNDISSEMIACVQKKHLKFSYILGDAEKIYFTPSDLITSNLAFQWFSSLETTLSSLWKNTKSLCFSLPIQGSFDSYQSLYESIEAPSPLLKLPTRKEVEDVCASLHPKHLYVKTNTFELSFSRPKDCVRYFHELGAHTSELSNKSALKKILAIKSPLTLRYVILFVLLEK